MTSTTITQAEVMILHFKRFRQVGVVVDPTTFGTSSVASATTARQTFVVKGSSVSGTSQQTKRLHKQQLVQLEKL